MNEKLEKKFDAMLCTDGCSSCKGIKLFVDKHYIAKEEHSKVFILDEEALNVLRNGNKEESLYTKE